MTNRVLKKALVDYLRASAPCIWATIYVYVVQGERGKPVCLWYGDVEEQIARPPVTCGMSKDSSVTRSGSIGQRDQPQGDAVMR